MKKKKYSKQKERSQMFLVESYKNALQELVSCCQSCDLATTEHIPVQLLASLRIMSDCTLYHVLFNSSPHRNLKYYHVGTDYMYKLPVSYVSRTQILNQVGCMYDFSRTLEILFVLIISSICQ